MAAEQVFDQAQGGWTDDDLLEQRIVPEHEAHELLAVAKDLRQLRRRDALAFASHAQQGFADGFVLLHRADFLRRQHGEAEGFQLGDMFEQVELLEFAVERRQRLRRGPVFDLHGAIIRRYLGGKAV